jgi:hypothetical protein
MRKNTTAVGTDGYTETEFPSLANFREASLRIGLTVWGTLLATIN